MVWDSLLQLCPASSWWAACPQHWCFLRTQGALREVCGSPGCQPHLSPGRALLAVVALSMCISATCVVPSLCACEGQVSSYHTE